MIVALARFVAALRAEDHAVSPAEIVDAGRALDLVGLAHRKDVRSALRATLAKDRRAAAAFDRLFDRFFTPPARAGTSRERRRAGTDDAPGRSRARPKEAASPPSKPGRARRDDRSGELRRIVEGARHAGDRRPGKLRRAKLCAAVDDAKDPARWDLARRMTTEEERAIAREVPRMVRALRLQAGRRLAGARAGRPWLRRALRDSLASGGVPFVIPFRAPKPKSTRVVLLVDVSFSVARAAGFFLLMAAAFLDLGRRARILVFVDRPVDATATIRNWARGLTGRRNARAGDRPRPRRGPRPGEGLSSGSVSFADVVEELRDLNLDAPSDYGRAFHALRTSPARPRGRASLLVILGDGRTNRFDPLPWALDELSRDCRAVLWLVPEPRSRWGTADSALPVYLPSVDLVAETTDLTGLARGLAELVRRL